MRKMDGSEFDSLVYFFDRMAKTKWLSAIHQQMKEATGSWEGKNIIDVGCGTGRFLQRGINEASQVTGIDISKEMIEACIKRYKQEKLDHKANFLVADAYQLPFSNHLFDLSVSTCVLFLLPDPTIALDEMVRVTKNDGMIAMLNPSLKMSTIEADKYCHNHQIEDFERETLLQWSKVSTLRHRYSTEQLSEYFKKKGAKSIEHMEVLDKLAIITVAKF